MTNTIFLIEDPTDLDEIIKIKKEINAKIYSLNYFTHKTLEKQKISHEIAEKFLEDGDKNQIDNEFINATINWHSSDRLAEYLNFRGINLANLLELELSQYLMPIYKSAYIIKKIIEKENPSDVIAYTHLNDFIAKICITKGIKTTLIDKSGQPSLQYDKINIKYNLGSIPISITVSRNLYLQIKRFTEKIVNFIFGLNQDSDPTKKSILLLDFNVTQYDVLLQKLSHLDKQILLLNQRRPAIWNYQSAQILKNTKCKILSLAKFEKNIKFKIDEQFFLFSQKLDELWSNDDNFEKFFSINSVTLWHSIKNSFIKICNSRFKESIYRILLLDELFSKYNISSILEWAELSQEEKEVLHIAKKHEINTVMLQHAMYPTAKYWNPFGRFVLFFSYPLMSTYQAVWGEVTKKHALSHSYNPNIIVTGSPRHDSFFNSNTHRKSNGTIVFATTQVSGINIEYSTTDIYLKFENFVREVCRVAKLFPEKKIIVKPHPAPNFINNVIELIREIDPNITISHTLKLQELITNCDLLITFNNSTIALDSIVLGTPTISLQIEKWAEESEIVKMGAILSISDIQDIESGMKQILFDEGFKNDLQKNAQKFVETYLSNRGMASNKLAEALDTL